MKINTLSYNCKKCNEPEIFNITGQLSESRHKLVSKCFDNKICLKCHCDEQKAVKQTAVNIVALWCC